MRFLLVAVAVLSCLETRGEDVVNSTVVDAVDVKLFIPHEADVVRGLILHVANYKMNPADRWAEAGRGMKFGHVQLLMDMKRNNRPVIMRKALDAALAQFAREHNRPELLHAPFVGTGHSAGGMCTSVLLKTPERTLTNMVSCGWVMDPSKNNDAANAAPYLATIGAIPDAFKMIPTIQSNYDPARAKGLAWGLGFMWGCAHDFGNSATLFIPWMEAITEMRLPADADPRKGPVTLREVKVEEGWLGDRSTWESAFPAVAPYAQFKGDKQTAIWLPNRKVTYVWRAFQAKDPAVQLEAATSDGDVRLAAYSPKQSREMMIDPGLDVTLSLSGKVKSVEFFDGDQSLGKTDGKPLAWKRPTQGAHPVFAVFETTDGQTATTSPALIVIRARPAPQ